MKPGNEVREEKERTDEERKKRVYLLGAAFAVSASLSLSTVC